MKQLLKLDLSQNNILNITELNNLAQLQVLNLNNNKIILCAPLKDLNISDLKSINNMIMDQFQLKKMKNFNYSWI